MPDTKIFIDTDEEISFIIEKIKNASTANVVVIVPDRASIFITSASLKLLKKSIDKLDKKVILVTMDETGQKMSEDLGITTVNRVRDVAPDLWNQVKKYTPLIKKTSGPKNNVYREIPDEDKYNPLIKSAVEENPAQSETKSEETNTDGIIEDDTTNLVSNNNTELEDGQPQDNVIPNLNEEKFQFKNESLDESEETLQQKDSNDETNLNSNENLEDNQEEFVAQKYSGQSYLESDNDEINEDALDSANGISTIGMVSEESKFLLPDFTHAEVNKKRRENFNPEEFVEEFTSNQDPEEDFIFFYGQDIAEKNIKKKFHFKK